MNGYNLIETTKLWDWRENLRIWDRGKPNPIWVTQLDIVANAIKEMNLAPLPSEHYPTAGAGQQAVMTGAQLAQVDQTEDCKGEKKIGPIFPGGLRCPHLHFKRDIYILNDDQWKTFSNKVIGGFKKKLSQVGTVGFEQLLETSDAISNLA